MAQQGSPGSAFLGTIITRLKSWGLSTAIAALVSVGTAACDMGNGVQPTILPTSTVVPATHPAETPAGLAAPSMVQTIQVSGAPVTATPVNVVPSPISSPHGTLTLVVAPAPSVAAVSTVHTGARYVFPVQPASVATYGPYHHDYPAVDIFCPIGSLFVAPTDGVVDYVSTHDTWDPAVDDPAGRGGLSVAIVGDDGVRYYGSHLSSVNQRIVPGLRVGAGEPLGKTGKSGDARYVDPHLHFGISPPTTPDDWKSRRGVYSPYKYLRAWAVGTQLRPVLK